MKTHILQVTNSSTFMREKPKESETISSQMLYGEQFEIELDSGHWLFGSCLSDKYKGWTKKKTLGTTSTYTHIVSSLRTFVLQEPDLKSKLIIYLPIISKIKVLDINNNWAKIELNNNTNLKFGYISSFHILHKDNYVDDWVKYAEAMLGVPYRWGGRDSFGVDCSALVQLSLAFKGIFLPRDSLDQYNFFKKNTNYIVKKEISGLNLLTRGNIIYWPGHIGIIINQNKMIHASGFHSSVIIEKLDSVISRIDRDPLFILSSDQV